MQTFLPFEDFHSCGAILDYARLSNQIWKESPVLFVAIQSFRERPFDNPTAWASHPAARMWGFYEDAFCLYNKVLSEVGYTRFENHAFLSWKEFWENRMSPEAFLHPRKIIMPPWLGWEPMHKSHRQNLTRKKPEYYSQHWNENPVEGYLWPVRFVQKKYIITGDWIVDKPHPIAWHSPEEYAQLPFDNRSQLLFEKEYLGTWNNLTCSVCGESLSNPEHISAHRGECPRNLPFVETCPLCGDSGEVLDHMEPRDYGEIIFDEPIYVPCDCQTGQLAYAHDARCPVCDQHAQYRRRDYIRVHSSGWWCDCCHKELDRPTWPRAFRTFEEWKSQQELI